MVHLDATALLQSQPLSHILDSGLRDALGRHAGALHNLASIESSKPVRGRLYIALTGTTAHTPLHCVLCGMNVVDNNEHGPVGSDGAIAMGPDDGTLVINADTAALPTPKKKREKKTISGGTASHVTC